jgi:hypothetical protein
LWDMGVNSRFASGLTEANRLLGSKRNLRTRSLIG